MRTDVRDRYNALIGWLEDFGYEIQAKHIRKGYVGKYVKSSNITYTLSGAIYCYGDGTQCLVRDADRGIS